MSYDINLSSIISHIRRSRFYSTKSGNVAMFFAIAMVPVFGAVGAAFDYSRLSNEQSHLQEALDSAALTAAIFYEIPDDERIAVANEVFKTFARNPCDEDANIYFRENFVTASSSCQLDTSFLGIIGVTKFNVEASATAGFSGQPVPVCVLALDPDAPSAIRFQGSADFLAPQCAVYANSTNTSALYSNAAVPPLANAFCVGGGYYGPFNPVPTVACPPLADPYGFQPIPYSGKKKQKNCSGTVYRSVTARIPAGIYCGGLTIEKDAHVTLDPGTYIIKDGPLQVETHSTLIGNGVTFFFTGQNSHVHLKAGAIVDITAPTSGDYAGLVFTQDKTSDPGTIPSNIQGGSTMKIVGTLHLPTHDLDFGGAGEIGTLSPSMAIIANTIVFRGNALATIKSDTNLADMPSNPLMMSTAGGGLVRLIE